MTFLDSTQSITLWHHQSDTTTVIPSALIRRFRHRLYSQVEDAAVPSNDAHWYFAPFKDLRPLPGDEIIESDGTVWTILEVNLSPLASLWQAVCETFTFAEPTESVEHLRQNGEGYDTVSALLPVRTGILITTLESKKSHKLTFYVRDPIMVELGDAFRRSDGTVWQIVRIEKPIYRRRWMSVFAER